MDNIELSELETFKAKPDSPFHPAEQLIQSKLGVRERMEQFGGQVIRDYFPDQHRQFYAQQRYIFTGFIDKCGRPWASIIAGKAGFLSSPTATTFEISSKLNPKDKFHELLSRDELGPKMGFLGIEFATRRRNRFSARLVDSDLSQGAFSFALDQSFGNCPQYIRSREVSWREDFDFQLSRCFDINALDADLRNWIESADTFMVASTNTPPPVQTESDGLERYGAHKESDNSARNGVDVSHRGGRPGFIKVEGGNTLTIPDYAGNLYFNTLGNFLENPRAGLLFIDFESNRMLQLTGKVKILWDDPRCEFFEGAERFWQFELETGRVIEHALPLSFQFNVHNDSEDKSESPNHALTGTWEEAKKQAQVKTLTQHWHRFRIVRTHDESDTIRSFYLLPVRDLGQPRFEPGQYLRVRVPEQTLKKAAIASADMPIRAYSVSSSPWHKGYRISVKREIAGQVSRYLHDQIRVGDELEIKLPSGEFYLPLESPKPALLLAGGVGITPMVAMAQALKHYRIQTRGGRRVVLVSAARNYAERAFHRELTELCAQSPGLIDYYSTISRPERDIAEGIRLDPESYPERADYHGRIDRTWLRGILLLDEYDVYLCGPNTFMQAMYDLVLSLGIPDERVFTESFGPSSLVRQRAEGSTKADARHEQVADSASIHFVKSGQELLWTPDQGTLLEFAEAHGFKPESSCRNGLCGTCATKVLCGELLHEPGVSAPKEHTLLCCSRPKSKQDESSHIFLDL